MARLSKADWFAVGERVLVALGATGLTVEELTRRAQVTKGSFYHHFGDRSGFVEAFLTHLAHRAFADVVEAVDPGAPPARQVRQLAVEIAGHDPTLEVAVRRWAVTEPTVATLVHEADARRLDYLRRLYSAATGDDAEGLRLARLTLALYLGSLELTPPAAGEEFLRMVGVIERLLPPEGPAPATRAGGRPGAAQGLPPGVR